jgi:protein ImuB
MPVAEARGLFQGTTNQKPPIDLQVDPRTPQSCSPAAPHFELHEPQDDHRALLQLAAWCQRFSPVVGLEQAESPGSLLLDVTGCAHLFSDEPGLLDRVDHDFHARKWLVRLSLADTVGAAWAVAHYAPGDRETCRLAPPGHQAVLRELPITSLRLPQQTCQTLFELDIRRIGQLQDLPRASLPSRLDPQVLQQLARMLGEIPEPILAIRTVPIAAAQRSFEHPLRHREALAIVLQQLIAEVVQQLQPRQQGIQRLLIRLRGKPDQEHSVGFLRPINSARYLAAMIDTRLQQQPLPAEISDVEVQATVTTPLGTQQNGLFAEPATKEKQQQFARFVEQLSTRLGEQAVQTTSLWADAQPEYAFRSQPLIRKTFSSRATPPLQRNALQKANTQEANAQEDWADFFAARPLWLKQQPQAITVLAAVADGPPIRFRWQGQQYTVRHSWGPERIQTGWWRSRPVERDYYRIETDHHQRLWLFRQAASNNASEWFLHGVFE